MSKIKILNREVTEAELAEMNRGFAEHAAKHNNPSKPSVRHTFVVLDGDKFIGCASGLRHDEDNWFFLTDLFVNKAYRGQGLGAAVLDRLEAKIAGLGIKYIWTWTAGYEAPGFYKKQGYQVFAELEDWYPSGHSRVGFKKRLIE